MTDFMKLHKRTEIQADEKTSILRCWTEGTQKYGDVLCFLISKAGKKYLRRGFFYNYFLITKPDYENLIKYGYWRNIQKYVLGVIDDSTPSDADIKEYEELSGLPFPTDYSGFVRIYYNRHTCEMRGDDVIIPTSKIDHFGNFRPETGRSYEQLQEEWERQNRELGMLETKDEKKRWYEANPFFLKCPPNNYTMQGDNKDKKYLQKELQKMGIQTYEAFVDQEERFFINHHDQYKYKQEPVIGVFDIETDDREKGRIIVGKHHILSFSYVGFNDYVEYGASAIKHISADRNLFIDDVEKQLLQKMIEVLDQYDVITGWNSAYFDIPYIQARMEYHNLFYDWRRIIHIDLMEDIYKVFYKSDRGDDSTSYALNSMGEVILGMNKIEHDAGIYEMWYSGDPLLETYNNRDVEICCGLEQKNGFLRNYFAMCYTSNIAPLADGNYSKVKRDFLVMCHRFKYYRCVDKTFSEKEDQKQGRKPVGGLVGEGKPCVVKNVIALDIGSLYPSVIQELNICPSTFIPVHEREDDKGEEYCRAINDAWFRKDRISFLSMMFGIIKEKRNYYKKVQKQLKEEGKISSKEFAVAEALEYAWKAKGLSIYGCLGLKSSILYNVDLVEAVTLTSGYFLTEGVRHLFGDYIHAELIRNANSDHSRRLEKYIVASTPDDKGIYNDMAEFIYNDTDSMYIQVKKELSTDMTEYVNELYVIGSAMVDDLHQQYEYIGQKMNMFGAKIFFDFEQIYSKMLFVEAKKKYAGVLCWHKGIIITGGESIIYKGFELKKSDGIVIGKHKQEELLRKILLTDYNLKDIQRWILQIRQYILGEGDGHPTFNELKETKKVSKTPDEYKTPSLPLAVRMMIQQQEEGKQINFGQRVSYVTTIASSQNTTSDGISEEKFNEILNKRGSAPYDKVYYWNAIYKKFDKILYAVAPDFPWGIFELHTSAKELFNDNIDDSVSDYMVERKKKASIFSI